MQTFLPYPDFARSAAVLDRQRLGKQRVECLQLVRAIRYGGSWTNHPAARMWREHVPALIAYGRAVCREWISRGYRDTCYDKLGEAMNDLRGWNGETGMPPWMGDPAFHASHRSNLLRKDPVYYGRFNWREPPDLPYVWPV